MGIGDGEQEEPFITHQQLRSQRHQHYQVVNKVLAEKGFDRFAERISAKFYAKKMGRPSMVPGVYFRCLLLGSIPLVRLRSAAHAAPATATNAVAGSFSDHGRNVRMVPGNWAANGKAIAGPQNCDNRSDASRRRDLAPGAARADAK